MNLGRRLGRVGVFGQAVVFVLFVRNLSAGLLERELTRLEAALRFPRGASRAIGDLVAGSGLGRRLRERSSSSQGLEADQRTQDCIERKLARVMTEVQGDQQLGAGVCERFLGRTSEVR
jgi:hypothetical protein